MGKKKDRALMAALQAAIDRASQPSPYENQMSQDYNNLRGWLDKKDYRNLPAGSSIDLLPLAEKQRMRQMYRGSGDTGQGQINPQILAQQQELGDNQLTQEWGAEYENKVGDLINQKNSLGNNLQNIYTNRMNTGVQGAATSLDAWRNRPKSAWGGFFKGLLQGGVQAASMAI